MRLDEGCVYLCKADSMMRVNSSVNTHKNCLAFGYHALYYSFDE